MAVCRGENSRFALRYQCAEEDGRTGWNNGHLHDEEARTH